VAVFIHPAVKDLKFTDFILQLFANASGLNTNMAKTSYYPIQCANIDLEFLANAGRVVSTLPCTYLGLALGTRKPSKAMLQLLIQKIGNRLPGWKRRYLTYSGRELLVKTVLSAMPTHYLTVFKMSKWAIAAVDRFRRGILWRGEDPNLVKGGHCLVNWEMCLRPKSLGGLGIKDIDKFRRALRLRWLWNAWDSNPRQWTQLLRIPDPTDRALFFSSTYIQVGDGRNTPFWEAKWLNAATLKDIAPNLYKMARMKNRIVFAELHNHSWIKNLREINSSIMLEEYIMCSLPCPLWPLRIRRIRFFDDELLMGNTLQLQHTPGSSMEP
jgi:hypothetical protein